MRSPLIVVVAAALAALLAAPAPASPPDPQQLVYSTEGNRLRRYDVDTIDAGPLVEDVLIDRASADPSGDPFPAQGFRDVNGMICRFRDGSGRFISGEDTGQPSPPAGWGVFDAEGNQVGKLTATYNNAGPEPFGCFIDSATGSVFTTDVGQQGFGFDDGQLIQWFPPFDQFPGPAPPDPNAYPNNTDVSDNFCKIDTALGTTAGVTMDSQGRLYVAASSQLSVFRYSGSWPTGLGVGEGCEATDGLGSPLVDPGRITKETFLGLSGLSTYTGLAMAPDGNSIYVSTVLEGKIREYDLDGNPIRTIVDHAVPAGTLPTPYGSPQTLSFGKDGTLYYADLDLQGTLPNVGPGPNGKVWRVRFDALGDPLTPEIVRQSLAFPDGVSLLAGDLEPSRRRSYLGGPKRQSFFSEESIITPANAGQLQMRWRFVSDGAITASPIVAEVDVPGEGRIRLAYVQSWDRNVYAVRVSDGSELWRFTTDEQPGATFPTAASVDVADIDGSDVVFVGSGQVMYALDAASGAELWRFYAGSGCGAFDPGGPPGLCTPDGLNDRNQIESSAIVADGRLIFGMDNNDVAVGKGGIYALDARAGHMLWFFDLESGQACRPLPGDDIRRYDGYHSEAELGLPAGFFASRPGCDHPRTKNGCGNVWSSPAVDFEREAFYIASSNCDTDNDPGTGEPPPPMPPYDEAIFALGFDGNPIWVWRPREIDNDDLAFGGVPNLFRIDIGGGEMRDALGVGGKDGTYYAIDRDGVNEATGVRWDDPGPKPVPLPYWQTNVVPGGDLGGIIASAAVDEQSRRVYFSTAAGTTADNDPGSGQPAQQPTLHALDMDTGAILWQNDAANGFTPPELASFAPTAAIPGVAFFGGIPGAPLRVHDGATGAELLNFNLVGLGMASVATVSQGLLLIGDGIGPGIDFLPGDINALCVSGTTGCAACDDGIDNDLDGDVDYPDDAGCSDAADVSEEPDCDDGIDNDHDGDVDYPADPGCRNRLPRAQESPECDDGIDNDDDGDTDLDDDLCDFSWGETESVPVPPACGLTGVEALLALGAVRALQRRARRRDSEDPAEPEAAEGSTGRCADG